MRLRTIVLASVLMLSLTVLAFATGETEAAADRQIELEMWWPGEGSDTATAYAEIFAMFEEENPGVTVSFTQIPWSEYFTKLNAGFAGGLAPDVFGLGFGQMGPVYANGMTLALDPYLEGWDGLEDIPDGVLDGGRVGGQLQSIMMPAIKVMAYRKDLFEAAGLDPESPPSTPEELLEFARILTQRSDGEMDMAGIQISTSSGEQDFFQAMLMFGQEQLWDDDYMPLFDTPEAIEALEYLASFMEEGLIFRSDEHSLAGGPFQNGLAAMVWSSNFEAYGTLEESFGEGTIGIALPPGDQVMGLAVFLTGFKNTDHPEEAVELMKAIMSVEGQTILWEAGIRLPTRRSLRDYLEGAHEFGAVAYDALNSFSGYGPPNPYFFDMINILRPALEEAYLGRTTAEEALTSAANEYRSVVGE